MNNDYIRFNKDEVFENLVKDRNNLAQIYYDITGKHIDPQKFNYDNLVSLIIRGSKDDISIYIDNKYVLLRAQSYISKKDIIRLATYMFLRFITYVRDNDLIYSDKTEFSIPSIEAYIIYTGNKDLPEIVSLDDLLPNNSNSMINAKVKIISKENVKGLVKEYIDFIHLEADYFENNKITKKDVLELIDDCIKNNILKKYLLDNKKEVALIIDNFFTKEKRINDLISKEIDKEIKENEILHYATLNLAKENLLEAGYPLEIIEEELSDIK